MQWLVEIGLSNALVAVVLAMAAWVAGSVSRRPAVTHALCLLVLLKLLTPPIFELPLPLPIARTAEDGSAVVAQATESMRQRQANKLQTSDHLIFVAEDPAGESTQFGADHPVLGVPRRAAITPGARTLAISASASAPPVGTNTDGSVADNMPASPAARTHPPVTYNNTIPWAWLGRICVVVWIIGTGAWFALQLLLGVRMAALLGQSSPAPAELAESAKQMAQRIGLGRSPELRVVAAATSPMLCGLGRACIVLPAALLGRLSPAALDTVLAHELAHYRRKDQWVRLLELIATGLYWWHPVVWWTRRRIEIAEEQCCDALVLQTCPARPRVYAEAILEIVDLINEPPRRCRPVMSSGMGYSPPLTNRLRDLMEGRCVPTMTPLGKRIIVVAGALCLSYHPTFFVTEAPSARAASVTKLDPSRRFAVAPRAREEVEPQGAPTTNDTTALPANAKAIGPQSQVGMTAVPPWATAISPNGRFQIFVRPGYACELHEVISGRTRELGPDPITCVTFAPDSGIFVTGDLAGTVRVWEAASGETLEVLSQQDNAVHSVAFSPIGDRIAVAGEDGKVEVVDLASPGEPRFAREMGAPVRCVRFSPDGDQIAVAIDTWRNTRGGSVTVFEIDSQSALHRWDAEGSVGAVQFQPDGSLLVVEWSGRVVQWHVPEIVPVGISSIAKDLVSAASFSADTRALEAAMDNAHP